MNDKGEPIINIEKCTGCRRCVRVCPTEALEIFFTPEQQKILEQLAKESAEKAAPEVEEEELEEEEARIAAKLKEYKGAWVFVEQTDGQPATVSWELLGVGADLAKTLDVELCTMVIGDNVQHLCQESFAYGASKVYLMDDPALANNQEDLYTQSLVELIEKHKPEIVIAAATSLGRSFIPRVAASLKTGLTADCTGLEIDPETGLLLQTRPTFGGNIMATITCQTKRPQMSTVRPRVFRKNAPDKSRKGQIIKIDFDKEGITSRTGLLDFIEDLTETVKLEDANVIVAGGRGLGKTENFGLIEELAEVMGAALGSSRPPVDDGWISYPHQVGQTGKTVCPRLYIACGISGAVQHLAGMQTADIIVAINDDPHAPIFEVATYGIVGDLFQVVPMLTEKLRS